ncbi:Fimbrial subunit type 1 precursor [Actinomyces bovis]|uniref:Fimbrial subunit type 1 n=1 Tax=Actinomyces bovis TaxID=1658 RepID=A0ABY1VML2_9ACTO|nr:SpaH/EbpB family LPXTG-anchored major pilin [Actinomyces bovis]SPT52922.1 Fimbrial subunit type 1 precursor [Actinomyces bovis]VEG55083.1 Fimbrial subunit type 1 precursor [Actinomyces israelii]
MKIAVRSLTRHAAVGIGAAALAAAGLGLIPTTAAAEGSALGNINHDAVGSLVIHKHVSGSQDRAGTPDGKTEVKAEGVQGVVFTAFPITSLDLRTSAAWDALKGLEVPSSACGAGSKNPALKLPGGQDAVFGQGQDSPATDNLGQATIAKLPVAAYLVCETATPANVVQKSLPFVATVPFPGQDGPWIYDVNVYPKNRLADAPTKTVRVSNHGLDNDGQLNYEVGQTIPVLDPGFSFSQFIVVDIMGEGQPYDSVTVSDVKVGEDTFARDVDYKVTVQDGKIYVSLTKKGLTEIKQRQGKRLVVTLVTKAIRVGEVSNSAETHVDTRPGENPPDEPPLTPPPGEVPQPAKKVFSSWGGLAATKQDKEGGKSLAGAKFEVYNAKAAYGNTCTQETDGEALTVAGEKTFTSDADGVVRIAGLFVDKGEASKAAGAAEYGESVWEHDNHHRCYVLKEIEAPRGYKLPSGRDALTPVKVTPGEANNAAEIVIQNQKRPRNPLAITGLAGQLVTAAGVGLLGLAVGLAIVRRRREDAAAA